MSKFHPLIVKDIIKETEDCISIGLDVPAAEAEIFKFNPGQFLTLRMEVNGEQLRRSYSICSCPYQEDLRIALKILPDGKFSNYAKSRLKPGDIIESLPPSGRFHTTLAPDHCRHYLAVAAGSGITPVISLVKSILWKEPQSKVTLIYGNKDRHSILFKGQVDALKDKYIQRFSVFHILSREKSDMALLKGRIDAEKMSFFLNHLIDPLCLDEVFICGPEEMIMENKRALEVAGVPSSHIHFELFTAAGATRTQEKPIVASSEGKICKALIKSDGNLISMDIPFERESILEAALRQGADLPYACMGGVCTACRAKLEKGEVFMPINYGLETDEIREGFILTCQSYPRTPEIVVNFDSK